MTHVYQTEAKVGAKVREIAGEDRRPGELPGEDGKRPEALRYPGSSGGHSGLIRFEAVTKRFWKKQRPIMALDDFSLTVNSGGFVGVLGPSGCGKSTLLHLVAGLIAPTSGRVLYNDVPVMSVNTRVGYMTQKDNLVPWRNVEKNVGLPLEISGTSRRQRAAAVHDYLGMVGLRGFKEHYPSELSGGMRKRVSLARTLIGNPETLLMDEPFGALDAQLQMSLREEVARIWERGSHTILWITHDIEEAIMLCDKVVVVSPRPGRINTIQDIDIDRPRDFMRMRGSARNAEIFEALWEALRGGPDSDPSASDVKGVRLAQ